MDLRRAAVRGEGGCEAAQPAAMCAEEVRAPLGPCSQHAARTSGQRVARDTTEQFRFFLSVYIPSFTSPVP